MTDLQKAALVTAILWGVAVFITAVKTSTHIATALWYAGWSVLAFFYAIQ